MSSRFYDMSYPQYTVHDVSVLTGLTPQTIRYYDSIGVVVPQRGAQGQRLYSYYDVLNLVRRSLYKAQGFSLQETEQVLSGIVTAALRSGGEQGLLHDYSLRYLRTTWRGNEYIIFADVSSANATMQNLWRSCILIGLCAAAVFLAVSFLLARWAVKPVERAWTQQKQFVSDASHELKTPLTVILTNAEMLRDPSYSEPERQRFAESILTM